MSELKSNAEWKQWGKDDPLWGVASWAKRQKGGAAPWTDEDFYSVGESDWREFWGHWQHYGVNTQSCVEVGCGAGRMTKQLAGSFSRVYAADVSEDMICYARKAVGSNVEFSVIDGIHLTQPDGSVKAVFSTHVLQHLDNIDVGFSYFREFYRVLDDGGTLMVHLPIYQFPAGKIGLPMRFFYALARSLDKIRSDVKRDLGIKFMRGTPYPIRELAVFLGDLGFKNVEFRIFATKSNNDLHPFVFATK